MTRVGILDFEPRLFPNSRGADARFRAVASPAWWLQATWWSPGEGFDAAGVDVVE
jgi:hypothetical protein